MTAGDGGRNIRVTALLQELVAAFLRNEANTDPMITVTHIVMSPDLKRAQVFISVYPNARENDALAFLKRKGRELRGFVRKKVDLKYIPFFDFVIDHGEKNRQRIDEISNNSNEQQL